MHMVYFFHSHICVKCYKRAGNLWVGERIKPSGVNGLIYPLWRVFFKSTVFEDQKRHFRVDSWPNQGIKDAFSNLPRSVWTGPKVDTCHWMPTWSCSNCVTYKHAGPRGGTPGSKWQGCAKDFFGVEIFDSGIFLGRKIWQVFFCVTWFK